MHAAAASLMHRKHMLVLRSRQLLQQCFVQLRLLLLQLLLDRPAAAAAQAAAVGEGGRSRHTVNAATARATAHGRPAVGSTVAKQHCQIACWHP